MSVDSAYPKDASDLLSDLHLLLDKQRQAYAAHPYPPLEQRQQWLKSLRQLLSDEREVLIDAISQDFSHRSADETLFAELMPSLHGIDYTLKHLKRWMKPSARSVDVMFQPASAHVMYQPLGVIGIIVPWNYPLYLAIGPLIGALAAGNRVMLKLSEFTPATGRLLKDLLGRIFPEDCVAVVLGEADVAVAFSGLAFDHLLFTGSTQVGKLVMRAAAEHLTPVTLELGGKSAAIVSADVPLKDAAQRIAWGKSLNAGQTCIAPDYVLVPENRVQGFVDAYRQVMHSFYPTLIDNPDYTAIINERQLARLEHLKTDAVAKGARLIPLYEQGQGRRMAHCLVLDVNDDMQVMQEEIFGPLLPVVAYRDLEQALAYITERPRPLALYYFGYNKVEQQRVLQNSHSGGVCINETLLHVAVDDLPFGGVGPSGMGRYHGHEGFLTFSHAKSVLAKQRVNSSLAIYPPYGRKLGRLVQKLFIR
ncbi:MULTISPECIES: coniferyl aldehyde dehydrogenase [unclassified Pseudomonas]|uniref:coniferyl aldehyde dehydrogenase n=1 Tax=unclassified Pseudomonas TaxID=196821 RepID=UPI000755E758|nr:MULTISPECIES: coniferyl aldehyde dehydrogenase [unclassified Pseudomonas]KVV01319.1 Coniferyl aldehyde dehydrogenase [Pseudomonas sp. TAD18]KVV02677.1 Coniferyl aldehyde dehydrogenase [Pseudomonas sp. TAA207]